MFWVHSGTVKSPGVRLYRCFAGGDACGDTVETHSDWLLILSVMISIMKWSSGTDWRFRSFFVSWQLFLIVIIQSLLWYRACYNTEFPAEKNRGDFTEKLTEIFLKKRYALTQELSDSSLLKMIRTALSFKNKESCGRIFKSGAFFVPVL